MTDLINGSNKFKEKDIVKVKSSLYPFVLGIVKDIIYFTNTYVLETYDKDVPICIQEEELEYATTDNINDYNSVFLHNIGKHLDKHNRKFCYHFKKHDLVLVTDDSDIWKLSYFDYYDDNYNDYVTVNGDRFEHCIPYFQNSKLLGKKYEATV